MSAPSLSKLTRLQTSTLTLLLERQRSLSLSLAPSQSTETTILRNLNQLNDGIEELFLEADDEGGEQGEKCGWKKLDEGLERLMGMWEEGGGEEKVRGIREGISSRRTASVRPPSPPLASAPAPPSSSTNPLSHLPSTGLPRTTTNFPNSSTSSLSSNNQPNVSSTPYKDNPSRNGGGGHGGGYRDDDDDGEERTEEGMMMQHQEIMSDQDARLSLLSSSINRQHHLSLQIGSELEEHHDLLLDTESQIDRTGARLARARGRLNGLVEGGKKNGSTVTIVVLIVLLAILILVFKT